MVKLTINDETINLSDCQAYALSWIISKGICGSNLEDTDIDTLYAISNSLWEKSRDNLSVCDVQEIFRALKHS